MCRRVKIGPCHRKPTEKAKAASLVSKIYKRAKKKQQDEPMGEGSEASDIVQSDSQALGIVQSDKRNVWSR